MNKPVCIIDDDEDVRAVMCFALEFEDIKTLPLENGLKAIEYLSKLSPDEYPCLIVVDYTMPEMNGIDFIKSIRKNFPDTLGKIPMALSTARIPDKDEYKLENLTILIKPIDLPDFINLVKSYYSPPYDSHFSF
jgi:CheY-like chemotaxis protein